MQVEHKFFVGVEDVDETNLLTDKGILDAFSNMANLHGLAVGQSTGDANLNHMGWVVLHWKVKAMNTSVLPYLSQSLL